MKMKWSNVKKYITTSNIANVLILKTNQICFTHNTAPRCWLQHVDFQQQCTQHLLLKGYWVCLIIQLLGPFHYHTSCIHDVVYVLGIYYNVYVHVWGICWNNKNLSVPKIVVPKRHFTNYIKIALFISIYAFLFWFCVLNLNYQFGDPWLLVFSFIAQ